MMDMVWSMRVQVSMPVTATPLKTDDHFSVACSTEMHCSLNGFCQDGGCVCDPGWSGP
eukprot:SAG31_NODE_43088_length_268_cov_1.218935_1_plen_57_part_01